MTTRITTPILVGLLVLSTVTTLSAGAIEKQNDGLAQVEVIRVVDGDTIEVQLPDGWVERVRYIGIDTPEVFGKTECFGEKSSWYNRALVEGKTVWLEYDVERRDKYDRILAYVFLDPNKAAMVNSILVIQGFAQVATYPPNVKYVDMFLELQRGARGDRRGLWQECQNNEPEEEDIRKKEDSLARVKIACIHFDASGNDHTNENGEWVLLAANNDRKLAGWTVRDEANHVYSFPENFQLKKGESARLYTGSEEQPKKDPGCGQNSDHELFWGSKSAIWNNRGDTAYLERNDETIDSCSYSGEGKEVSCTRD